MNNEKITLVIIILLALLYWSIKNFGLLSQDFYEITFFDIKLWDATLIKTPENKTILIDWWEWDNLLPKLSSELWFFEKKIDLIILSHPDSDHIGWLVELIKRFKIWEIWLTRQEFSSSEFDEFLNTIIENQISYKFVNDKYDLIFDNNTIINTIYPFESWEWDEYCIKDINDCSLVVKITLWKEEKKSILFTWDIWKSIEEILIRKSANLKSDILKSPHHWSKHNLDENFLKIVDPEIAIIMADKDNRFWHPHKETLNAYENQWIETLITWETGDIKLTIK